MKKKVSKGIVQLCCAIFTLFVCATAAAQQTGKFTYQGKEVNLPPDAVFRPKFFKFIDYSEKLNTVNNQSVNKNFMAEFSEEDIQKFETIYQEDYTYYQEAVTYFNKLSDKVNRALTVKQLWYIYMYDQELKNKLLYF
ncbi:MAG: hypothetical protein HRT69_17435 [Flavobacteriaceae bacterium]|nr:hypothetical protein [Flavobacteriaceae bacterium]